MTPPYVPRSQRLGHRELETGIEGIPEHCAGALQRYVEEFLDFLPTFADQLAIRLRISLPGHRRAAAELADLVTPQNDPDEALDILEGVLHESARRGDPYLVRAARGVLELGGSAYTVTDEGLIEDAVAPEIAQVRDKALSVSDVASQELVSAWNHAYGRTPDASDAWDHAIKAVESILVPEVSPNDVKATLGKIIGELNAPVQSFEFFLPGSDGSHSTEPLLGVLRCLWANPDRHGPVQREPSLEEARAVVTLAATVLNWHRTNGWLVREKAT